MLRTITRVRRFFGIFLLLAAVPMATQATAQAPDSPPDSTILRSDPFLGMTTYRLWSGMAPDAYSEDPDEMPTVTVVAPREMPANGTAVVIAPGGGYVGLASVLEGMDVASWFSARGVTAFILKYRVGPKARLPIPFSDGARAMRFARTYAEHFKIDPNRIGMMGFSAGGHLTATTAGMADAGDPDASDPIERVSSRPDFMILGYPWLEGMAIDPATGTSQYCMFTRDETCDPKEYEKYLPIDLVSADIPPTFIYHTTNDDLVPVAGSVRYYAALEELGVPVEMHLFANGHHGTGLGGTDPSLQLWPVTLGEWMRGRGLLPPPPPRPPLAPPEQ